MPLNLDERPVWLTVIGALAAGLLGFVGVCLGAFGACMALIVGSSSKGGLFAPDTAWLWGVLAVAVVCTIASIALVVWLIKKPKPK